MPGTVREGRWKELRVISELLRFGLDVYPAAVDDQGIDCVIRTEHGGPPAYYDVQIKGYRGYNRVIGVDRARVEQQAGKYLLIIAFFHDRAKPDEIFFLTQPQVLRLKDNLPPGKDRWGDVAFNKPDRDEFAEQTIDKLKDFLEGHTPEGANTT